MDSIAHQLTRPLSRWRLGHHRRSGTGSDGEPPSAPGGPVPTGVRLRRRAVDDVDSAARILRGISSSGQYPVPRPESHRAWLVDDVVEAWVAERRGLVVGHVALKAVGDDPRAALRWREVTGQPPGDLAVVSCFFVRGTDRGHGIGGRLLATAVEGARARGLLPVAEIVSADRYGHATYDRAGWRLVGRYPYGPKGDGRTSYLYTMPAATGEA